MTQAGSYVGPDKLRFDFRHGQPLTRDQVVEIERIVNDWIVQNHPLHIFVTNQDHARELGATMLFGEKYGEHVRVVEIDGVSRELCGGTHVRSTAEIGAFVLTRETSSSQGVRRIEAITSAAAIQHLRERSELLNELVEAVADRDKEIKRLKERSRGPRAETNGGAEAGLAETAIEQGGLHVIAASVLNVDSDSLLQASDPAEGEAGSRGDRAGLHSGRPGAPGRKLRSERRRPGALGRRRDPRGGADRRRRGWGTADHGPRRRQRPRRARTRHRGGAHDGARPAG